MPSLTGLLAFDMLIHLLAFVFGCCLASFINVVAYRLPRRMDYIAGRSECPRCAHSLSALDLIPLLGFVLLGGRCRYCQKRISMRYFIVELVGGVLAVLPLMVYGVHWVTLPVIAFLLGLLLIALIDGDTMEIPNGTLIYLILPAIALTFMLPGYDLLSHGIGLFTISLPLYLIALLIRDSFGGGDIKMMAVCGLALGWQLTLVAFFIALILGGGYGMYLMWIKKESGKSHFAFGPCLALGVGAALLFGQPALDWYMQTFFNAW